MTTETRPGQDSSFAASLRARRDVCCHAAQPPLELSLFCLPQRFVTMAEQRVQLAVGGARPYRSQQYTSQASRWAAVL